MKIHVISETPFIMKATGVHTAFVDHVNLLKEKDDVDVTVNEEGGGDIIHSHTYGPYYLWKGRKYKGRRIFTAHVIPDSVRGSLQNWKIIMPLVRKGLKMIYSFSDVCIAISPMVEDAIRSTGAETRIVRIDNPVNTEFWKKTAEKRKLGRQMLGLSDTEFVVIGVGQVSPRKGIEDFIDISEALPDTRFVWIGDNILSAMTERIYRINQRLKNKKKNFLHAGQVPLSMMPYMYASADLMLFTSYQENSPLAPIEAAASGIPVIFRDLEEYRRLYSHPYLKACDNGEFIQLTRKMINDRCFYEEGKKLSAGLITQFKKENIRNEFLDLYKDLINN